MQQKIVLIATFLMLQWGVQAQTSLSPERAAILQQKLDSCVTAFDLPGISASIINADDDYWNGASGLSHIYTLDSMNTEHLFYQASVTKMFVASVIFQMIEQNLLSLEDTVGEYLPAMATIPANTKIRYLLNHRSGLYNFIGDNPASPNTWFTHPDSIWTPQLAIETYNDNPIFSQGSAFAYSNTNYIVLGMIIEQITGNTFATELKNRILIPYNLNQTFFPPMDSIAGNLVTGWTSFTSFSGPYTTDASPILNDCSSSMFFTAGALVASPKDVTTFTRALLSGEFVSDTTLALMKTCTNVGLGNGCNGYGYGLMRYVFNGKTYFGHAGDLSGFTNLTIHQDMDNVTLTISINRNHALRGDIAEAILSTLEQNLSISNNENETEKFPINLYPNPTSGSITVDFSSPKSKNIRLEIFNHLGQTVHNETLIPNSKSCKISLENQTDGIYFLQISDDIKMETKKFIIQK